MPITVTTQDLSHPSSLPTRSAPLYLIFHSSPWDPVSQSWCPDCRNARAALLDVFQSQDGAEAWVLLTDREQWKKKSEGEAQHPWRDQAGWGVKCLPTLLRVEGVSVCASFLMVALAAGPPTNHYAPLVSSRRRIHAS